MVKHDKHTLNGATLNVSLEVRDNAEDISKTIQITGLATTTTKDSILNYFENERRSGGGDVETVDFRRKAGVAFVTFKDVDGRSLRLTNFPFQVRITIGSTKKKVEKSQ